MGGRNAGVDYFSYPAHPKYLHIEKTQYEIYIRFSKLELVYSQRSPRVAQTDVATPSPPTARATRLQTACMELLLLSNGRRHMRPSRSTEVSPTYKAVSFNVSLTGRRRR